MTIIKTLRVIGGIILLLAGLTFLCGFLPIIGFYLVDELNGPRQDNEGLHILGTFCAITLVLGVSGILGAIRLFGFSWTSYIGTLWVVILFASGAVLLGVPGAIILSPPGPMSDGDSLLAWLLVAGSVGMTIMALRLWLRPESK